MYKKQNIGYTQLVGPLVEVLKDCICKYVFFLLYTIYLNINKINCSHGHVPIYVGKFFFHFVYVIKIYTHKIHGAPIIPVTSAHGCAENCH